MLNLLPRLHLLIALWLGWAWTGVLFGMTLAGTEPANADASVHSVTHELVVYVRDGWAWSFFCGLIGCCDPAMA